MRFLVPLCLFLMAAAPAGAEIQVVDGVKYECKDGLCRIVEDEPEPAAPAATNVVVGRTVSRMTQGYLPAKDFVRWLEGNDEPADIWLTTSAGSAAFWLGLLLILLGGLAMNLTPCVLPMVPINLMIIGKSVVRGLWYALGITLAYGTLGVLAVVYGLGFGELQGSPWFNLFVAIVFVMLALSLLDVFIIDLSKRRTAFAQRKQAYGPWLFAFLMGALSAVLAGACVAPILIGVLVLAAKLASEGKALALALPFVLGLGMALPWPFLGAGMKVLPKPGIWMKWVNRAFALVVFAFALWYAHLAYLGFVRHAEVGDGMREATPETFAGTLAAVCAQSTKPVLVDCWATWCKNCGAMAVEMEKPNVREALKGFEVIRLQAEDLKALKALKGFEGIRGLPAFVIFR